MIDVDGGELLPVMCKGEEFPELETEELDEALGSI